MQIEPAKRLQGTVTLPGDKSISHRYAILGAIANGKTEISGYPASQDCHSTLACLQLLGTQVIINGASVRISGRGIDGFRPPVEPLDAGNSGTTIRLLSGVLASLSFTTTIGGDSSLNQRPMRRITDPLSRMGASIEAREDQFPPLKIKGGALSGIEYRMPIASAQVKSCILLAGLNARGRTSVIEPAPCRDHTERALPIFGAKLDRQPHGCRLDGPQRLRGAQVSVPGDFSAAAFLLVAALLLPDSRITLPATGLNPSRTGLLQLLRTAGADIQIREENELNGEPVGTVEVSYSERLLNEFPAEVGGDWIPNLIDEIPILAILGCRLKKGLRVRDAAELRRKESDRISMVADNLRQLGVQIEEAPDGFFVPPGQSLSGGRVETGGDHRIAMAFAVAGLISGGPVLLDDASCCAVSFPDFFGQLERLRQ